MDQKKELPTGSPPVDGTLAAVIAKDRLDTIIHEVGHLTVALALGFPAEVHIQPNKTKDPLHEKTWTGSCRLNYMHRRPTNRERTMIGLAGWLAKLLHEAPDADLYEEINAVDLHGVIDEGLSDTDLGSLTVNNQWIVKWAEEVCALFAKFADFRDWAVAKLAEQEIITESEAVAEFPEQRKFARYRAFDREMQKLAEAAMKRFSCPPEDHCHLPENGSSPEAGGGN